MRVITDINSLISSHGESKNDRTLRRTILRMSEGLSFEDHLKEAGGLEYDVKLAPTVLTRYHVLPVDTFTRSDDSDPISNMP